MGMLSKETSYGYAAIQVAHLDVIQPILRPAMRYWRRVKLLILHLLYINECAVGFSTQLNGVIEWMAEGTARWTIRCSIHVRTRT